ncbi:ABC transporter ATP-binding protein [Patescibacteria group bacterium]|nr:ABC transporter ATP-binding protein [Patescibacteria group bacterium]
MIKLENINKIYTNDGVEAQVLYNISFNIKKGEFVAIIGPSGSGKSTLMHILGALDRPTSGIYILNNQDVENLSDSDLAKIRNKEIGFIFQSYNLLPRMSALKNVMLPMAYAGVRKKEREIRATESLKIVGLEDKMQSPPNKLSGGQKQRVAIARALTMNPSILLADEPTGNLPTKQSNEIINIFENLNKQGNTVLIITHNDEIAKRAKRVITLVDGKIVSDVNNKK